MALLQAVDGKVFGVVNHSLANPVFDWLMPKQAGNQLFMRCMLRAGVLVLSNGGPQ